MVSVHFPYPPRSGVNMRVYQLLRQIASRHETTLLSYAHPDEQDRVAALRAQLPVRVVQRRAPSGWGKRAAQLGSLPARAPFSAREVHSPAMQAALDELCTAEAFDVIQLESSLLCGFRLPPGPKVVLDEHNIEYEVFERMREGERSLVRRVFNRREAMRFRRFEQEAWTRVDACVVTSEREQPVVREAAPETVTAVVPNGVDVEHFAPHSAPAQPRTLVFNGTLEYRPNVDAAHWLVERIWPRVLMRCPDAQLAIVGRAPDALAKRLSRPGVTVTGEVPDVRPYLHRAAVVAVPIRMGGGTRLKVVEGLAMGKAMVSTSLGCEGIAVRDGEHLLLANTPEAFAARVVDLFHHPELRRHLGRHGRRLAETRYAWELAGDGLEDLYQEVTAAPASRPAPVLV